jgi:methionyl-tRNA formyltransferase
MGTPDFATGLLKEIASRGHEVAAVYTQPPRPAGRGLEPRKSPVHLVAESYGLPVFTPRSLRGASETAEFTAHDADVAVVAAYGLILPRAILEAPRLGCLNLHGSILPRWRGAAPIQRAILAGDLESGVSVMKMEEGLDTGPVATEARVPIGPDTTAGELHDPLAVAGARLMADALEQLARGQLIFVPQSQQGVTYAQKIDKAEARIDWSKPAPEVHNLIRALAPFPGAFFEADLGKGLERIKILRAHLAGGAGAPGLVLDDALTIACGDGAIQITELQRSGKAPVTAADFLRGARLAPGTRLARKHSDAPL